LLELAWRFEWPQVQLTVIFWTGYAVSLKNKREYILFWQIKRRELAVNDDHDENITCREADCPFIPEATG
jgi:hypothetical protein